MSAPKPDLTTIHGRLHDARQRRGFNRDEFAALMGYSMNGWAKIELGVNALSAKTLHKANETLKLDERYYFGKLSYDDAQSDRVATVEELHRRLAGITAVGVGSGDPSIDALAKPAIKCVVNRLRHLSDARLQRIVDKMDAYLDALEENGTASIGAGPEASG